MFKVGDKVVCIKNSYSDFYVKPNKSYSIIYINDITKIIKIDDNTEKKYCIDRFILLKKLRRNKLKKIECDKRGN
jgi:hypothetical protein